MVLEIKKSKESHLFPYGHSLQSSITNWGNSLGIRIPVTLAKKIGVTEGTPIDFKIENDAIIIRRKRYDLETLLAQITPKNLHKEISAGNPAGREIW